MSITPLRRPMTPVIEDDAPKPDPNAISVVVDDDGNTEITIGTPKPEKPKAGPADDFDENLAERLADSALASLAAHLIESVEADDQDRADWLDTANRAADYLGIKLNDPAASVADDGTICQDIATCMQKAAMKLWSTAYGELLPAGGPVKAVHEDSVPTGSTDDQTEQSDDAMDKLADALERDLNWYLTDGDKGYYPDTSKMLMSRAIIGVQFKEIYRCPIERRPISRWIMAQDLIVKGDPTHLHALGGRVTARKKVPQSVMKRLQKMGFYLDVPLVHPTGEVSATEVSTGQAIGISPAPTLPRDYDHTIYEVYCEIGSSSSFSLSGDLAELETDETGEAPGYPLPYQISIDVDSRTVLRIARFWRKGDADHRPRRRFVKYGFIPGLNTGIYDLGLIHLVGNPTQSATMLLRSGVDAALLGNFPSWAQKQGPASRGENTVFRPAPGEVVKIPTSGSDKIGDVLMPWPYKPMTPETLALMAKLEKDVEDIAGIVSLPLGEGRIGNTPVGTIMSYIEAISQVPGAVHKADHVAQAEEFGILRELLSDEPWLLTRGNPTPARKWQVGEELTSPNVAPRADPNTPSQIHRLLKIQGLVAAGGLPQFMGIADNRAIYRKVVETLVGEDAVHFEMPAQSPQQAQPDPKILTAMIKAKTETDKATNQQQEAQMEHQAKMQELAVTSADKAADREAANQREAMKAVGARAKVGADMVTQGLTHAHEQQRALTAPLSAPESAPGGDE